MNDKELPNIDIILGIKVPRKKQNRNKMSKFIIMTGSFCQPPLDQKPTIIRRLLLISSPTHPHILSWSCVATEEQSEEQST
jgi:hypothetical protein